MTDHLWVEMLALMESFRVSILSLKLLCLSVCMNECVWLCMQRPEVSESVELKS